MGKRSPFRRQSVRSPVESPLGDSRPSFGTTARRHLGGCRGVCRSRLATGKAPYCELGIPARRTSGRVRSGEITVLINRAGDSRPAARSASWMWLHTGIPSQPPRAKPVGVRCIVRYVDVYTGPSVHGLADRADRESQKEWRVYRPSRALGDVGDVVRGGRAGAAERVACWSATFSFAC